GGRRGAGRGVRGLAPGGTGAAARRRPGLKARPALLRRAVRLPRDDSGARVRLANRAAGSNGSPRGRAGRPGPNGNAFHPRKGKLAARRGRKETDLVGKLTRWPLCRRGGPLAKAPSIPRPTTPRRRALVVPFGAGVESGVGRLALASSLPCGLRRQRSSGP